jgi:2-polyprenyl-6-methoxyphenol hydroxylase-like FAD-dependent oxidoreductase
MVAPRGKRAVVIGAGIGGLAAAAALAGHFDDVTIIERDAIPADAEARPGTPQSNHPHGLLVGGQRALCELFPGIDQDLADAGAVPLRAGLDIREEFPGFDPCFPRRDIGWVGFAMSRPLIELVVRRRVSRLQNVELRDRCRVIAIEAASDGSVAGVRCETNVGTAMTFQADLVVDASGRGVPALDFLKATGRPQPEQTSIGVDINYTTTTFAVPKGERDWQLVITFPEMPESTRAGHLMPMEGDRWMVLVSERHGEPSSTDLKDFLDLVRRLRTPTIFDAIKNAKPLDRIHRFGFPESSWRHYERLVNPPRGLLVLGDAMCRFNPVYGQGMTIAAQEASLLKGLLQESIAAKDTLDGLERAFFIGAQPLIAAAWSLSATPDFIDPRTRGEPPADLEDSLRFRAGLMRLAAADSDVHKLFVGVRNLIEPASKLHDPDLVRRIQAEMADAQRLRKNGTANVRPETAKN